MSSVMSASYKTYVKIIYRSHRRISRHILIQNVFAESEKLHTEKKI